MTSLFLSHLFASYTCFLSGIVFYYCVQDKTVLVPDKESKHLILFLITGLISLTLVGQVLALILPVTLVVSIALLILLQSFILLKWKRFKPLISTALVQLKKLHTLTKFGIALTWLFLLLLNAGPTLMDDTESYHIQMIKWIHEYGTVRGIANVHERYGFNSSWFSSIALFTLPTKYNFYTGLNGLLSLWICFYFWTFINKIFTKANERNSISIAFTALILLAFCLASWPILRGNASTANYDSIAMIVILVLFSDTVVNNRSSSSFKFETEWLLWPVYLFTVRIINYPFLLLTLFIFYQLIIANRWKSLLAYSFISLLLILPFLARTVFLSGYLFYPSPFLNIFDVDWKVDDKVITDLLYFIKYYNRVNPMFQPLETTEALGSIYWVKDWYKYLFTYDKIIVIPGMIGYLVSIIWGRKTLFNSKFSALFFLTLIIQLVSWFFVAPDPRFAYGCFICGIVLLFLPFLSKLNNLFIKRASFTFITAILLFIAGLGVRKYISDERYKNILLPYRLPEPPVTKIKVDNVAVNVPEAILNNWNSRCYATDLPCAYKVDPRLHLRGEKVSEGFFIKKK